MRLTPPPPPALSLLCHILHESLGYRLSVLHVPRFSGCGISALREPPVMLRTNMNDIATGIVLIYQTTEFPVTKSNRWAGPAYFSISIALNVLLTLAIVIRLILHARNVRTAMGGTGISGLCKAIVTMLVESCAIYAVSSLLVVGPAVAGSPIANVFMSVVPQTQVRVFFHDRDLWTSCLM